MQILLKPIRTVHVFPKETDGQLVKEYVVLILSLIILSVGLQAVLIILIIIGLFGNFFMPHGTAVRELLIQIKRSKTI